MVAQLQAQNPLEPTSDTQYVSELAQFSQLEQTTNLAESNTEQAGTARTAQAVQLIGHKVSYTDPSTGATVQGTVESVEITSSGAALTIEGVAGIEPGAISQVSGSASSSIRLCCNRDPPARPSAADRPLRAAVERPRRGRRLPTP